MADTKTLKIMIVDDHNIVRHSLKQTLAKEEGITVVAEAENGRDAVVLSKKYHPDIILMDISMPELNGIEATQQILKSGLDTKIIALSIHEEKEYVISMIKAGAKGYLLKSNLFTQLMTAIKTVAQGNAYLSPEITEHVVDSLVKTSKREKHQGIGRLTAREREVLQMTAEGQTTSGISERLYISTKTVNAHKRNIMKKLGVDNIPALTKLAIKNGVSDLHS